MHTILFFGMYRKRFEEFPDRKPGHYMFYKSKCTKKSVFPPHEFFFKKGYVYQLELLLIILLARFIQVYIIINYKKRKNIHYVDICLKNGAFLVIFR